VNANYVDIASRDAYIVSTMTASLGEFEVLVLMAVMHLGDRAYPPAIRTAIERRAQRKVARGAVYVTLDRLEAKGLLLARVTNASGPGRPRRSYNISSSGLRAVRRAVASVEGMRLGLEPLLEQS
jgi:DNA-binding PadR family transcriptional regulator